MQSKMGSFETDVSVMGEMVRNTLLRVADTISGFALGKSNTGKLREIKTLQFREQPVKLARRKGKH